MRITNATFSVLLLAGSFACGSNTSQGGFGDVDGGSLTGDGGSGSGSGGVLGDGGGTGPTGAAVIYAHTDKELYTMDPTSHQVTDVGPFDDGSGSTLTITDLAVDAEGDVIVNSETAIYRATVPSGTGTVHLTLHTQLPSGSKFYALGFTPAGAIESGESLIAGDSTGSLYYIPSTAQATPQNLGSFGGGWQLSGDVMFYTAGGTTVGLATIRQCNPTCSTTNDSLAQIDMNALKQAFTSNSKSTALLAQVIGSGTGYGELFGIGGWGNSVYAFSRSHSGAPAQLVQIGASGAGTSLQTFGSISSGWSGAGVTTKAPVTVVQ